MAKFEFEHQMDIYKKLLEEAERYELEGRFEQALNIYLNAEKIAKKYGSKNEKGNIIQRKAKILAQKGNLNDALTAFKESLKLLKKGNGTALQIANVNEAIGDSFRINGYLKEAIDAYQTSLKILRDEKERVVYTHSHLTNQIFEAISNQLNKISEVYLVLGNLDKALDYSREALKVSLDINSFSIALISRFSIAKIYSEKGDYETALEYLLKSMEMCKKVEDIDNSLHILLEIADIYKLKNDNKTAFNYYKKALKLSEKTDNLFKMTEILAKIGQMYLEKNNKKKALEFFLRSKDIGSKLNQYYFDFILYYLGLIYFLDHNFETSYDNFKNSIEFAKKNKNEKIEIESLLKIGDICKFRDNFDDAIYYYKRVLEKTRNLEQKSIILCKIGIINLLNDNIIESYENILESYKWLRILILSGVNIERNNDIFDKLLKIPYCLCAVKCIEFNKTQEYEILKEALGYSEFNYAQVMQKHLNSKSLPDNKSEEIKILKRTQEKCLEILELNNEYQIEKDYKLRDKLWLKIQEIQNEIFLSVEELWEMGSNSIGVFPFAVEKIMNKFLEISGDIPDQEVILDFIYVENINLLNIFLLDMKKKEINLFSRELNKNFVKQIKNKLEMIEKTGIKEKSIEYEKYITFFNKMWNKLVPKILTDHLFKKKYGSYSIIAHSFFKNIPWSELKINNPSLNEDFKIQTLDSLYSLIIGKL